MRRAHPFRRKVPRTTWAFIVKRLAEAKLAKRSTESMRVPKLLVCCLAMLTGGTVTSLAFDAITPIEIQARAITAFDPNQEEVYIPLAGSATLLTGERRFDLVPGVMARVGPEHPDAISADPSSERATTTVVFDGCVSDTGAPPAAQPSSRRRFRRSRRSR